MHLEVLTMGQTKSHGNFPLFKPARKQYFWDVRHPLLLGPRICHRELVKNKAERGAHPQHRPRFLPPVGAYVIQHWSELVPVVAPGAVIDVPSKAGG